MAKVLEIVIFDPKKPELVFCPYCKLCIGLPSPYEMENTSVVCSFCNKKYGIIIKTEGGEKLNEKMV